MNLRLAAILVAPLLLSACNEAAEVSPAVAQAPAFDAKAAAFVEAQGDATIQGHAFMVEDSGSVHNAAGQAVELIPATAYARARFASLYGNGKLRGFSLFPQTVSPADPDYLRLMRTTRAESSGRFSFDHVAPGTYFVATQVVWKKAGDLVARGGAIYERVTVTGKETKPIHLVLTGR